MRFGAASVAVRCCSSARPAKRSTISRATLRRKPARRSDCIGSACGSSRRASRPSTSPAADSLRRAVWRWRRWRRTPPSRSRSTRRSITCSRSPTSALSAGRWRRPCANLRHADADVDHARAARPERPGRRAARAALRPASRRRRARGRRSALSHRGKGRAGGRRRHRGRAARWLCSSLLDLAVTDEATLDVVAALAGRAGETLATVPEGDDRTLAALRRLPGAVETAAPVCERRPRTRWIASGASCSLPTIRRPPGAAPDSPDLTFFSAPGEGREGGSRSHAPSWRKRPAACLSIGWRCCCGRPACTPDCSRRRSTAPVSGRGSPGAPASPILPGAHSWRCLPVRRNASPPGASRSTSPLDRCPGSTPAAGRRVIGAVGYRPTALPRRPRVRRRRRFSISSRNPRPAWMTPGRIDPTATTSRSSRERFARRPAGSGCWSNRRSSAAGIAGSGG